MKYHKKFIVLLGLACTLHASPFCFIYADIDVEIKSCSPAGMEIVCYGTADDKNMVIRGGAKSSAGDLEIKAEEEARKAVIDTLKIKAKEADVYFKTKGKWKVKKDKK